MLAPTADLKSIYFDPQLRAKCPRLAQACALLAKRLLAQEIDLGLRTRSRTSASSKGFRTSLEALICNFLVLHLVGADAALAVPRSHNVMWSGRRYRNPIYGQHFLDAVDLICTLEFTRRLRTGFRISSRRKAATLIVATPRLTDIVPLHQFGVDAIMRTEDAEVLVLKKAKDPDGETALADYSETSTTSRLRSQVRRLNKWLRESDIRLDRESSRIRLGQDGKVIAPFRLTARRIFNNENWQHGGRLAGPFFMSMERSARFEELRIDGERIADVDYRQLFATLAYVRAQCPHPDGDLYDIYGDGSSRTGWKTLVSALLFARGRLGNWPEDTRHHFPEGTTLRSAVEAIYRKHSGISHLFCTGLGYSLMKIESDMILAVTTHLFQRGITALPIHDGILCARSKSEEVRDVMQYRFETMTGSSRAIVKIDLGPI